MSEPTWPTWETLAKRAVEQLRKAVLEASCERANGFGPPYAVPNVARRLDQIAQEVEDVLLSPATADAL